MSKQSPSSPDSASSDLRELIREAHAATRDLSRLIREAKQILSSTAQETVDRAMEDKVNTEIGKLNDFLKAESERVSRHMETEIAKAREWMMQHLELIAITETPDGLRAEFSRKDQE